jgi:hypothetical protein
MTLQAACHYEVLCGDVPDAATCLANLQERPHLFPSLPQLTAQGRITYDGAAAKRCLDKLNGLTTCARSVVDAPGALDDCAFLTGNVPAGQPCVFNEECLNGGTCNSLTACDTFAQCCPGTCSSGPTPVPLGGQCGLLNLACVRGTTCVAAPGATVATCQTPAMVGDSCASIPCARALYCDPDTYTCRALPAEGGACAGAVGLACDDPRDGCDASGHCAPLLPVRAACGGVLGCVAWAACDGNTSTCVPRPRVGESCLTTSVASCLSGTCDSTSSTCVLLPVGGSCL